MQTYDIIIIGTGPAGIATARALSRIMPGLAARTLMIDRHTHPRPQRYGAPVTGAMLKALAPLDLDVLSVPHVELTRAQFRYGDHRQDVFFESPWLLVRRDELDAWLFKQVAQEVDVHEGERVVSIDHEGEFVIVESEQHTYRARLLIGADGSDSMVRAAIHERCRYRPSPFTSLSRASVQAHATVEIDGVPLEDQGCLVYDFSLLARGRAGYLWHSASAFDEQPQIHVGVILHRASLSDDPAAVLDEWLREHADEGHVSVSPMLHSEHHYDEQAPLAAPQMMLVGEAAGIDPLLSDGLAQCLEYGRLAAHVARDAFEQRAFDLEGYNESLRKCPLGRQMNTSQQFTERLFGADWRFWVSLLINRPGFGELLARQASGLDALHQRKLYLTVTTLLHRLIGDKELPESAL